MMLSNGPHDSLQHTTLPGRATPHSIIVSICAADRVLLDTPSHAGILGASNANFKTLLFGFPAG
ncbi:hypothetical protein ZHAS_00020570 [Anopheles sinensis]|uniref:Uncharacterized protein n=1 Tax=Anopheles sinensis TaxID=74873 RepID=A0A084WQ60_ANOSI|nr:hypothetical protein ZHAS_00020570 [Anopheles sinensis]